MAGLAYVDQQLQLQPYADLDYKATFYNCLLFVGTDDSNLKDTYTLHKDTFKHSKFNIDSYKGMIKRLIHETNH